MHIPDGLLSAPVSVTCAALSALAIGTAAARARSCLGTRAVAMVGVTGAFVFATQMVNFPIVSGTSAHLIGGVLAAVLLGPSTAIVVMTAVLILQCLAFGDGGLLSLGANTLNMAVVHPIVGYSAYCAVVGETTAHGLSRPRRRIAGAAFGAWVATVAGAAVCAGEIALSRIGSPAVVLGAMVGVHAVVGLGEAVVTALVLSAVLRVRPELVGSLANAPRGHGTAIALGLATSLALALFVSPFACAWPDSLERVASRVGLDPSRARVVFVAPMNRYEVNAIRSHVWSTSLAALAGIFLVFGLCCVLGWWLAPRPRTSAHRAMATAPRILSSST